MTKRKPTPDGGTSNKRESQLTTQPEETPERKMARLAAAGVLENACTIRTFGKGTLGEIQTPDAFHALQDRAEAMCRGDLSAAESLLAAQASSLNSIFAELARRAAANMGTHLSATDIYLRLALKAQAQCRATLEALATIKAGPIVITRQANIAHGPQQVNNGVPGPAHADARAGNSNSAQNELLGASDGERLDSGTTSAAGGGDPVLEAMGAVHRPG